MSELTSQPDKGLGVCDVGRRLTHEERVGGLVWSAPCSHPAKLVLWLYDEAFQLVLCSPHFVALAAAGLLDDPEKCRPGDSNPDAGPALN